MPSHLANCWEIISGCWPTTLKQVGLSNWSFWKQKFTHKQVVQVSSDLTTCLRIQPAIASFCHMNHDSLMFCF